jgi:hypothetical protein
VRLRHVFALAFVGIAGFAAASIATGSALSPFGLTTDTGTTGTATTSTDTSATTSTDTTATTSTTTTGGTTTTPATTTTATTGTTATTETTTTQTTPTQSTTTTPPVPPPTEPTRPIQIIPLTVESDPVLEASLGPAPPNVTDVTARLGDRRIAMSWRNPPDPSFDHVEITRTPGRGGNVQSLVYTGRGTAFSERGLRDEQEYRYVIASVSRTGARAPGVLVIATGAQRLLLTPRDGVRLTRPPIMRWAKVNGASYYNVQLFKGKRKIGTWWPKTPRHRLARAWTFDGKQMRLTRGTYTWFVWPGFGKLGKASYGDLLGESTFTIVRRD